MEKYLCTRETGYLLIAIWECVNQERQKQMQAKCKDKVLALCSGNGVRHANGNSKKRP